MSIVLHLSRELLLVEGYTASLYARRSTNSPTARATTSNSAHLAAAENVLQSNIADALLILNINL